MKNTNIVFQSSKIFVTAVTFISLLRELPISNDFLWISTGMSPILHTNSTVSWILLGVEMIFIAGLWTDMANRFTGILAYCIAGVGILSASLIVFLSHVSSCALLPAGVLPEMLLAQKLLFAGAVVIAVRTRR
ncbi:hypothetical protein CRI93_13145 [Longimonas halophila]|uniref:Uncharacterized protein n=1 Tax=Longimonas halophila TaxID=1469170 RepID=A0A2H3NIV0_9BACT|nr:hypothetical protein [Longimonas halophila]PEN05454.1 hypothetical protein CRI93_13145 [Longimonas halophila]